MLYIASPYSSGADSELMLKRYLDVRRFTAQLLMNRVWCYSPIVHCHELAAKFTLPKDAEYWRSYNEHVLKRCDTLVVHKQDGWDTSEGVRFEIDCAKANGLQIFSHYPSTPVVTFIEDYKSKDLQL